MNILPIIYPKELEMNLTIEELEELTIQDISCSLIQGNQKYIYDEEKNIRLYTFTSLSIYDREDLDESLSIKNEIQSDNCITFHDLQTDTCKQTLDESSEDTFSVSSYPIQLMAEGSIMYNETSAGPSYTYPKYNPKRTKREDPEDYEIGNMPRKAYTDYNENYANANFKPKGKACTGEVFTSGQLLQITAGDPQLLEEHVGQWKQNTINAYTKSGRVFSKAEDLFAYLETFLGTTAIAIWEDYKVKRQGEYSRLLSLGLHPYNFVNKIGTLATGADPNEGHVFLQREHLRHFEQMKLKRMDKIKPFLNEAIYHIAMAGAATDLGVKQRLLDKLPGPLGLEISKRYADMPGKDEMNIVQLGQLIMGIMKEKCTYYQVQKQVQKGETSFCKQIITPQHYESDKPKKKKKHRYASRSSKTFNKPKRIAWVAKSSKRKPFLDPQRHVRKYRPNRTYKKKIVCYGCGKQGHLSTECSQMYSGLLTEQAEIVQLINEDLIPIDSGIESDESIWSIRSEKVFERGKDSSSEEELILTGFSNDSSDESN